MDQVERTLSVDMTVGQDVAEKDMAMMKEKLMGW